MRRSRRPPARAASRQDGFTLIEVLVALAIAGVALAAVMRTMGVMTQNNGKLRDHALALLSAENRLNELDLDATGPFRSERFACPQGLARFQCEQNVVTLKTGVRRITVDVYRDGAGRPRVATLQRLMEAR